MEHSDTGIWFGLFNSTTKVNGPYKRVMLVMVVSVLEGECISSGGKMGYGIDEKQLLLHFVADSGAGKAGVVDC
jgi:hypothetical protein